MLKNVGKNIKDHPIFFLGYLIFLMILVVILLMYSKTESLIIVNHSWNYYQDIFVTLRS